MPVEGWLVFIPVVVVTLVPLLAKAFVDKGERPSGRMVAGVAFSLAVVGAGAMVFGWEMARMGYRTVPDSDWTIQSGKVNDDRRDPATELRYVRTDTGYQVQVDGTKQYPMGMRLTFACPKKEGWYGNRYESFCQLERPEKEQKFHHYPFSGKEVGLSVGLNGLAGFLGFLIGLLGRPEAKPSLPDDGPLDDLL